MSENFLDRFQKYARKGLEELGLELPPETFEKLLQYFAHLKELGRPLGLTALEDPLDFAVKHLLDSLTILPHLPEGPLLDLGTGAGLPGMVVKIVEPEREIWLVDARKKPVSFLTFVNGALGLPGTKIVQATVGKNDPLPRDYFAGVVSRATAELKTLWNLSKPLLRKDGRLIAMKGPKAQKEIDALLKEEPALSIEAHPLRLPLTGDRRTIVVVRESPS